VGSGTMNPLPLFFGGKMMETKVKFCGICSEQDIDYVNITKPDYIGFVFVKSRWRVSADIAMKLRKRLAEDIIPIGVFRDEPKENILSLYQNGTIQMATFYGGRAYPLDFPSITLWPDSGGEFVLFDQSKDGIGGTGERLNWNDLPKPDKPFFLAGGLTAENVEEAIRLTRPYAVDVISGIETDGKKDLMKMRKFMERVRNNA
jgi:phosphoribosylanthranilate isomerase